ncbi:MAG: 16S rRNA methyltransferase [Thermoplasmata archaeon]
MLNLILADSEIELIPEELWNHPSVIKHAQRRGKKARNIILDSNFHHSAIKQFFPGEENRRGRPDIVHYFLLNSLESPLNLSGNLTVYVHTRNNFTIFIRPETKIPKSYNRFLGLMEDLFHNGYVPSGDKPLIRIEELNLKSLLKKINIENIIVMCSDAKIEKMQDFLERNQVIIIGGFPSGNFISNIQNYRRLSIFKESLTAWVTAYEIISNYELKFSII